MPRPGKDPALLQRLHQTLRDGAHILTEHAKLRMQQRDITVTAVPQVLDGDAHED